MLTIVIKKSIITGSVACHGACIFVLLYEVLQYQKRIFTELVMNIFYMDIKEIDDEKYNTYLNKVSAYRKNKVKRLKLENDSKLSLASGILLYLALDKYNISEGMCEYSVSEHGKPFLRDFPDIKFNISHSGALAVLFFDAMDTNNRYGIDVEKIKPFSKKLADRVFSKADMEILDSLSEKDACEYFAKVWTGMEAYAKMTGTGLEFTSGNLKQVTDNAFVEKQNIFFKEFKISNEDEYIITICSDNSKISDLWCTKISL